MANDRGERRGVPSGASEAAVDPICRHVRGAGSTASRPDSRGRDGRRQGGGGGLVPEVRRSRDEEGPSCGRWISFSAEVPEAASPQKRQALKYAIVLAALILALGAMATAYIATRDVDDTDKPTRQGPLPRCLEYGPDPEGPGVAPCVRFDW